VSSEFTKIALATGAGFLVMGFIGFFVKLMCVIFVSDINLCSVMSMLLLAQMKCKLHKTAKECNAIASGIVD
jgi:hypothetical protein